MKKLEKTYTDKYGRKYYFCFTVTETGVTVEQGNSAGNYEEFCDEIPGGTIQDADDYITGVIKSL